MKSKLFVVLSMLFASSLGQDLTCIFSNFTQHGNPHYGCTLTIQNPDGFDNFTSIEGDHDEGRINSDVTVFLTHYESVTTNLPQIICSQFPNLVYIEISSNQVEKIYENSISGCQNLETLILWTNRIEEIHPRAFANNNKLINIDLDYNLLKTLDEDIFDNLEQLRELELSNNPFTSIPAGLFKNLVNLNYLIMDNVKISEINPEWFSNLPNLETLSLVYNRLSYINVSAFSSVPKLKQLAIGYNPIVDMSPNVFNGLSNLEALSLAETKISTLRTEWFEQLSNLKELYLYSNKFTSIPAYIFDPLISLEFLNIGQNELTEKDIPEELFDFLLNLEVLAAYMNSIRTINPRWFQNLGNLTYLDFDFNLIIDLPNEVFAANNNLEKVSFQKNNIKTISGDAFGNIGKLNYLDFDENLINAIDEKFLNEANELIYFYLADNICVNKRFIKFAINRDNYIPDLALCTKNFRPTFDTETIAGAPYEFFEAPVIGIQFRVNGSECIQIALSKTNSMSNPILELHVGCDDNSISRIIVNQTDTVVNIRTPNILRNNEWNAFRVTWAYNVVSMYLETKQFPFISHTMEDIFDVNFIGLRSPNANAIELFNPLSQ